MKIIEKDILTVEKGIICHQTNSRGGFGSGIAGQIKNKWPQVCENYKNYVSLHKKQNLSVLGHVDLTNISDCENGKSLNNKWVANIFGQDDFGYDGKQYTSYEAWEKAMPILKIIANRMGNPDIYFPYLCGCGLGGGSWEIISEIIERNFPNAIICKLPKK